ncbi:hypothetical protein DVA67_003695 [Solirubrobacter sp. CPCC 204708]|uniref:Uncharacterized protein n=1 Tax=Solirubrobacter deserti TaxID=2282478 RepID=A0ABT4RTT6_9ACTN|nr:hypothetical protein [Solirubrobacter deserti]MBE2315064.1 hypothetical protein [Solirubrobacter deserti]MDA0141902.1 hypothetical protein [Solirubrobacter deserti]
MRATIAVLLLLALAPAAHARSYSIAAPVADTLAVTGGDIVLAAGHVVWLESRGAGDVLVAAGPDGVRRDIAAFPPGRGERLLSVVGSANTVLAQRALCRGRCLDDNDHPGEALRVDLATGAQSRDHPCGRPVPFTFFALDRTAFGAACNADSRVVDVADGARATVPGQLRALAGRFAAASDAEAGALVVSDWRTGAVVSRVRIGEKPLWLVELSEDGTLVYSLGETLERLAPGAARSERLPEGIETRVSGGATATRDDDGVITVGERRVTVEGLQPYWAFDGARVAWVARPCGDLVVQVWDLAEGPPAPAPSACADARVGTVKLAGDHLKVRLTCPRAAVGTGCAGWVDAKLSRRGRTVTTGGDSYVLASGRSVTMTIWLPRTPRARPLVARVKSGDAPAVRRPVRG